MTFLRGIAAVPVVALCGCWDVGAVATPCTIRCSGEGLCPSGMDCSADGYCHGQADDSDCSPPPAEAAPDAAPAPVVDECGGPCDQPPVSCAGECEIGRAHV